MAFVRTETPIPPARVLVFEQSRSALRCLDALASEERWELRTATDLADALQLGQDWLPDLLLVHVQEPDQRAQDLCRRLKADPAAAAAPILLVSDGDPGPGESDPEHAEAHLVCPAAPVLRAMVRALLRVHSAAGEAAERARAEHRAVLEAIADGLVIFDRDGRLLDMNPAALAMHGFEAVEPLRRRISELQELFEVQTLEGEPLPVDRWPIVRALRGEVFTGYEVRVRRLDGGREWIGSFGGRPVADASGRTALAIVTVRDLTEQRRAETATREREELLRLALSASGAGAWSWDLPTGALRWSEEYFRLFGFDPEKDQPSVEAALGRVHPDDLPEVEARIRDAVERGSRTDVVHRVVCPDGSVRWLRGISKAFFDGGRPSRLTGIAIDVTDQKRADEALRDSEQRLNSVIENLSEGLFVSDLAGRTLHWNRAALQMHGYAGDEDELGYLSRLGAVYQLRTLEGELVPFEEWPIARLLRGETFRERELRVRDTRRGWERVFSYTGGLIPGGGDSSPLALLSIRDVTEGRRAEQGLRESEERFRGFAEGIPHLTFITDALGSITYTNGRFFEYFGIPPRKPEPSGWSSPLLYHPADLRPTVEAWTSGIASGAAFRIEYRLRRHDGQFRWHVTQVAPVRDAEGRLSMWVGTSTDVHDQRQAAQALEIANAQLREADRRKNEFLAVLSHELRNPLAPIRNSVFVLEHAAPGGTQARRAQEVIDRQTRQLTRLVDDLLEVTRITQGKIRLHREVLELNALVQRCAEDHRDLFASAGVTLETDIAAEPAHVNGDPARLAQVVGNLLSNATKFTPPGGRARLSLELPDERQVVVRLADDGVGLAPEMLDRVFDPFVQAETTLDRTHGGLGLGLAVLKGLVVLHGGSVAARSGGRGLGAEFVVSLPRASIEQDRRGLERRRERLERSRRILVIEDNADAAESLQAVLELKGHDVVVAHTGPEGVEKARHTTPDVVLCDIGLPGMDGFEVARALRAEPALARTRLVALSGYALPEDVERARAAGFDRHLAKPVDPDDLLVAISSRRRSEGVRGGPQEG